MANKKYFYCIVDKDTGAFPKDYSSNDIQAVKLPIFFKELHAL